MKKLFTKKQIINAIKITTLSAILIVGLNYANAAWSGPTASAPDGNTPAPVNIGILSQIKNGGLGVNALSVFGDGLFTGKATANRFCFTNGVCVSSWPEACAITQSSTPTATLTASPTSVAYNGQSVLTWSSTNATGCSANWTSSTATSGNATKSNLTSTTAYTITCTGANGSAQASATVTVGSAPPPPPPPPPACTEQTYYEDKDKDRYGTGSVIGSACDIPTGYTTTSTDCNDNDASVWRTANGYVDNDYDGYGAGPLLTCVGSQNIVSNNTDCYDSNSSARPGQTQCFSSDRGDGSFDYNCDGGQTLGYYNSSFYKCIDSGLAGQWRAELRTIPTNSVGYSTIYEKSGGKCKDTNTALGATKWAFPISQYGLGDCGSTVSTYACDGPKDWWLGDNTCDISNRPCGGYSGGYTISSLGCY